VDLHSSERDRLRVTSDEFAHSRIRLTNGRCSAPLLFRPWDRLIQHSLPSVCPKLLGDEAAARGGGLTRGLAATARCRALAALRRGNGRRASLNVRHQNAAYA
jgi:hypothetical protein